jgi:hypothetical protein
MKKPEKKAKKGTAAPKDLKVRKPVKGGWGDYLGGSIKPRA